MYGVPILYIDRFRFLFTYYAVLNNNIFSNKPLILRFERFLTERISFIRIFFYLIYNIYCLFKSIMRVFSPAIFSEDNLVSIERSNLPARIPLYPIFCLPLIPFRF